MSSAGQVSCHRHRRWDLEGSETRPSGEMTPCFSVPRKTLYTNERRLQIAQTTTAKEGGLTSAAAAQVFWVRLRVLATVPGRTRTRAEQLVIVGGVGLGRPSTVCVGQLVRGGRCPSRRSSNSSSLACTRKARGGSREMFSV